MGVYTCAIRSARKELWLSADAATQLPGEADSVWDLQLTGRRQAWETAALLGIALIIGLQSQASSHPVFIQRIFL